MLEIVLIILVIIIGSYLLYIFNEKNPAVPGPWCLPILGYLHKLDPKAPYLTLTKLAKKYGSIYKLKLGTMDTVVISDAKLIRKILLKDESVGRPGFYLLDRIFKGEGIVYSVGDIWKERRKFSSNFLRTVGAVKNAANREMVENEINESAERFIQSVKKQGNYVTLNAMEEIQHYVSSISNLLFLGKTAAKHEKQIIQSTEELMKLAALAGPLNFLPILRFLPYFANTVRSIEKSFNNVHRIYKEIINEESKREDENSVTNMIQAFLIQKSKIASEKMYDLKQLQFLLFDIYAASVETSSVTIMWTVLYLAAYPEVQNKVRQEMFDYMKDKTAHFDDLDNLPYTRATIYEAARIRPVAPMGFPHYALGDIHVENVTISKGTTIIPLIWAMHMDAKTWKAPEEFRPERFLNDDGKFQPNDRFMAFLTGKRVCIGKDLGEMIIFLFLTNVLRRFKIENKSISDFAGDFNITFTPKQKELIFIEI